MEEKLPCPSRADAGTVQVVAEFNRQASLLDASVLASLLPAGVRRDAPFLRLERLYGAADALSLDAAREHRRALGLLAAAGTVLTVAFLLYDEAELIWMIWLVGAMLALQATLQRRARRSRAHERYVEYRALAECLRVQALLHHAGSGLALGELLSWSQRDELPWVAAVMDELAATEPGEPHDIADCWVRDQQRYHQRAAVRAGAALERSERVVSVATVASVALYAAALAFELVWGGLTPGTVPVANVGLWRAGLKIALGSLSAATLFVSGYYGNLSLPRVLADHERLARFYAQAGVWLAEQGQTEALLARIAREELAENANWCSYQRDNAPGINL